MNAPIPVTPFRLLDFIIDLGQDIYKAMIYCVLNDNKSHRTLLYTILFGLFFFTICFIRYAYVEKYGVTDSLLYGNLNFSFVDNSYPEIYGYFLELFCASILAVYALAHKQYQWLAWTAIFIIAFVDDALRLHENIGGILQADFGISERLKEPLAFSILGLSFCLFWSGGLFHGPKSGYEFTTYMLFTIYFGLLVFFGVGIDALHGFLKEHYQVSETLMTLAEDGMELAILCLCAVTGHGFWCAQKDRLPWKK